MSAWQRGNNPRGGSGGRGGRPGPGRQPPREGSAAGSTSSFSHPETASVPSLEPLSRGGAVGERPTSIQQEVPWRPSGLAGFASTEKEVTVLDPTPTSSPSTEEKKNLLLSQSPGTFNYEGESLAEVGSEAEQETGGKEVDLSTEVAKELVEWEKKRNNKNLKKQHGTKGKTVEILTNRVNIISVPKQISVFHFKFEDAQGKESRDKVDITKSLDITNEPIAYDGSRIVVQYGVSQTGVKNGVKNVHQDNFVLDSLKNLLVTYKDRIYFELRENRTMNMDAEDLLPQDVQYLNIVFTKNLPKAMIKHLDEQSFCGDRGGRGGGRGGGGPHIDSQTLDIQYKYRTALIYSEAGPQLTLDVSGNIVYKKMPLLEFLHKSGYMTGGRFDKDLKYVLADIQELKLRPSHRPDAKPVRIKAFSDEPAGRLKTDEIDGKVWTVAQYFKDKYKLNINANLPCVRTSTKKRIFYPLECVDIVSEQRFRRELPRAALKDIHLPPQKRLENITHGLKQTMTSLQRSSNGTIKLATAMTKVPGREIGTTAAPTRFFKPVKLTKWVVVNADGKLQSNEVSNGIGSFMDAAKKYGMTVSPPMSNPISIRYPNDLEPALKPFMQQGLEFVLLIKFEQDKHLYKEAKYFSYVKSGLPIQVSLSKHYRKPLDSYMKNLLLKVNMKLGGLNFVHDRPIKGLSPKTLVLGLDVSHGMLNVAPSEENASNSTVALVSSSHMRSAFASQAARTEIVVKEIMTKLLTEVVGDNPGQFESVIFYRDGVSESMFNRVDTHEIPALRQFFPPSTKITFVVLQKRHRTKFFKLTAQGVDNPQAGTVIDTIVTNQFDFDFFLQAHKCGIGTACVPHYVVLHDENKFSGDDLQNLTNQLSCLYQRSFGAVSQTTASYYAHLLAEQCRFLMNEKGEMPKLHPRLKQISQMFFL